MPQNAPTLSLNPYAAPEAHLVDQDPDGIGEPAYFPVGIPKLALMCLATFGLYEIYWFYRNWKAVERTHNVRLIAPLRALFYPVTAYFLFQRIAAESQRLGIGSSLQIGALAIGVFVIASLARLPDPWWLLALLSFLPLIPIQLVVNEINQRVAPAAPENSSFGAANIIALVLGGLLMVLVIIGTVVDPTA